MQAVILAGGLGSRLSELTEQIPKPIGDGVGNLDIGALLEFHRRVAHGPLTIEGISSGEYRSLSSDEVLALYDAAGVRPSDEVRPSKRQLKRERTKERRAK